MMGLLTHPGHGIHQRSISQQTANHFHLTCPCCHVESCLTTLISKDRTFTSSSCQALALWKLILERHMLTYLILCKSDHWVQNTNKLSSSYSQCYGHQARLHSAAGGGRCWGDPWRLLHGWVSDQTRVRKKKKGSRIDKHYISEDNRSMYYANLKPAQNKNMSPQ